MGLHHRKLTSCKPCRAPDYCFPYSECYDVCLNSERCYDYFSRYVDKPSPIPPAYSSEDDSPPPNKHHHVSIILIISLSTIAAAFLVICCYAIYARFFSGRFRSGTRRGSQPQAEESQSDFLDEEHGPVVDHPIWYIRTTGLQQSIISAITVCRYKKGEGLIEGTECSVCLCEFQEDENLRLLPKCNHAFHLPCIDTWLRSHTNCPMCRAPIVLNPARFPSIEPGAMDSSFVENTQMEILENSREISEGLENGTPELRNGEEEEGQLEVEDGGRVSENPTAEVENMQTRRRSVSLDSSSATKINLALATVLSSANGNSNSQLGEVNVAVGSKRVTGNENLPTTKGSSSSRTRYLQSAPTSMKRSRSNSWYGRSQRKPSVPVRSF